MSALLALITLALAPAEFDIPAGHSYDTILTWSAQAGVEVAFVRKVVEPFNTRAVKGKFEPLEALKEMLRPTPLLAEYGTPRSVAITEKDHYCHPEWGPEIAPLPPCVQQPLYLQFIPCEISQNDVRFGPLKCHKR